ncbi:hypothetical protein ACFL5O_06465, partial [Myxococcota bacterium]
PASLLGSGSAGLGSTEDLVWRKDPIASCAVVVQRLWRSTALPTGIKRNQSAVDIWCDNCIN